jgi:hypothetical protein
MHKTFAPPKRPPLDAIGWNAAHASLAQRPPHGMNARQAMPRDQNRDKADSHAGM